MSGKMNKSTKKPEKKDLEQNDQPLEDQELDKVSGGIRFDGALNQNPNSTTYDPRPTNQIVTNWDDMEK